MRRVVAVGLFALLAGCGGTLSTEDCLRQLKEGDVVKKRQAIRELGNRIDEADRAVPALIEALRDESSYVRRDAALVLGKFGEGAKPAVPALLKACADKDRGVRKAAQRSLKAIDPTAARIGPDAPAMN